MKRLFTWIAACGALALLGFVLLMGVAFQAAGAANSGQESGCRAPGSSPSNNAASSPVPTAATPAGTEDNEGYCYPSSRYGAQVVQWAKAMANALYVDPSCGQRRGGSVTMSGIPARSRSQ